MNRVDVSEDSTTNEPQTVAGALGPRRFGRRGLIAGAIASTVPLYAIERGLKAGGRSTDSNQAIMPALGADGTPMASPAAATPIATAAPTMFGQLQIIDDQRPSYSDQPANSNGDLKLLLTAGDNSNFNPAAMKQDFQIMASYMDPLVWIDNVTMEPKPGLAKSFSYSQDGKSIVFILQNTVNWHDGSRFTADDVVFSLFVYRDDVDSAVRNLFQTMDLAERVDKYTVKVTLNAPDGAFVFNAASQLMFQRKQYTKYWASNPEGERSLSNFNWDTSAPVGTGPFSVDKRSGTSIHVSRNSKHWQGPAHFEGVMFTWQPDTTSRLKAFTSGDADVLWPVQPADLELVKNTAGRVYVADTASVMFAAFNFNNPKRAKPDLLSDIRIRRALSLAIDRNRYAQQVFGGYIHQHQAGTIAQPWANDQTVTNPNRDINEAKSLLQQSGWEDKSNQGHVKNSAGESLDLSIIVRNDDRGDLLALLQGLVADLAQIGVGLTVRQMDAGAFNKSWIETHDFDLVAYAYNLYPGFSDFDLYGSGWNIGVNAQGWNPGGYGNAGVDKTIKSILAETSENDLKASLKTLQQQTNDDLFGLWFGFPRDLVLVREDILGYTPNKQCQVWNTRLLWRKV